MDKFVDSLASDPGIAIGTLAIIVGCLTGIIISTTAFVCDAWRRVRETEDTNSLKQHLLESGLTADEIATVVTAKPGKKLSIDRRAAGVSERVSRSPVREAAPSS
jgi:hypothetical protein